MVGPTSRLVMARWRHQRTIPTWKTFRLSGSVLECSFGTRLACPLDLVAVGWTLFCVSLHLLRDEFSVSVIIFVRGVITYGNYWSKRWLCSQLEDKSNLIWLVGMCAPVDGRLLGGFSLRNLNQSWWELPFQPAVTREIQFFSPLNWSKLINLIVDM